MSLIISGIIDGPLSGGVPKAIELTVLADIPDLSIYGLESANNGGGAGGAEFAFPAPAASAGDTIWVASEATGFTDFFGFAPDYVSSSASINGDDAILLYENGTVIDTFGDPDVDGSGQPWEYTDGWAYRNAGSVPTPNFSAGDWTFSGPDALDGAADNATATTPFPAGSFSAPAGSALVAAEDFDGGDINLISGFESASGNLDGGAGDFFGVGSLGAWPQAGGVPFSLADDTVADLSGGGVSPGDAEGTFGQNADAENDFFALTDSDEFGTAQTASWTFGILGYEDLLLSIAMGGLSDGDSFGGYGPQVVSFTYSIDGGAEQTAFALASTTDTGDFQFRPMDIGTVTTDVGVLQVTGDNAVTKFLAEDGSEAGDTFLDKASVDTGTLDTFLTALDGTGSTLTLTMAADVPFEAMAFDDIRITGTEAPVEGSVFSIATLDSVVDEGDAGTTALTFTVTRAGDASGEASVDWAVSGDVDAADFGGTLPAGTVTFAADETEVAITLDVSGDTDIEADEDFTVSLSNPVGGTISAGSADGRIVNDDLVVTMIHDVQGNAATWGEQFGRTDATPFFGATVEVSAIVVGDFQNGDGDDSRNLGGFYLQEEDSDADTDATTSEGVFVFEGDLLTDVNLGDRVTVIGTATEFFGETQIEAASVTVVPGDSALPTAAEVAFPIADVITNPDGQLIADLEAYEGMLARVAQDMTVADLFEYGRFGEIGLYADGRLEAYTQNNAPDVAGFQDYVENAVRNTMTLDDGRTVQNPFTLPYPDGAYDTDDGLSSGDTVSDIVGVLRYSRSSGGSGDENYRINPVEAPTFEDTFPRQETPPDVGGSLKVASFNVLNYFNGDGMGGGFPTSRGASTLEEFLRQQEKLVAAISEIDADVVGLIEIENDGYGPESAIASLVAALNAEMGAGTYDYVDPAVPQIGSDEIAVGFIYKPATVELVGEAAILDKTVDPRFDSDNQRPSLAQSFSEIGTGGTFTAVVNHLKSKGSPVAGTPGDEDAGDGAGNANTTRTLAAEALADWIASDPTGAGDEDVLVMGDLNAYAMEDPIQTLLAGSDGTFGTADDLSNLSTDYTYGFPVDLATAGQVQAFGSLDYGIGSQSISGQVTGAATWHINADEPALIDYNTEFKPANPDIYAPDAFRSSDHDPVIVGLDLEPEALLARIEFTRDFLRQKVVYSLEGTEVSKDRLKLISREIEVDDAGISISASDDGSWFPVKLTAIGDGLGVASLRDGLSLEQVQVDDGERMRFDLADVTGLGDALSVGFEFASETGAGQVALSFYDDGTVVEEVSLDVLEGGIDHDLDGSRSFDRVDVGMTGDLALAIEGAEFLRLEVDGFALA